MNTGIWKATTYGSKAEPSSIRNHLPICQKRKSNYCDSTYLKHFLGDHDIHKMVVGTKIEVLDQFPHGNNSLKTLKKLGGKDISFST